MVVLRRRSDNIVQFASFTFVAVVLVLARRDGIAVLIAIPMCALAVRCARNGVYVGDGAVVIRNTFRTVRLALTDVERVDVGRYGFFGLSVMVLRDTRGQTVPLWSLQPRSRKRLRPSTQVAELAKVQRALGLLDRP